MSARASKTRLARELLGTLRTPAARGVANADADDIIDEPSASGRNRRRHDRLDQPTLVVAIGAKKFSTQDWSLGGMSITGFQGETQIGLSQRVTLTIHQQQVPVTIRTRRYSRSTQVLAVEFVNPPQETVRLLDGLKRQQMNRRGGRTRH